MNFFLYFRKEIFRTLAWRNVLIFPENELPTLIFQEVTSQAWKTRKPFSYFRKWHFLATSLKNLFFRRFSYGYLSLLLQGFFFHHWILLFNFTADFYYCFSPNSSPWLFFLAYTELFCCCTASATDLRKRGFSLVSGVLHVTLLLLIWQNLHCFYQGFPGNKLFFLESCKVSYWGAKRRTVLSIFIIIIIIIIILNHTVYSDRY